MHICCIHHYPPFSNYRYLSLSELQNVAIPKPDFLFFLWSSHSDTTLRYKETRRRKQEAPADRDCPLGNGNTATPSGRSKLNGSSDTLRQRKTWGPSAGQSWSAINSWRRKDKVWWAKLEGGRRTHVEGSRWTGMCCIDCAYKRGWGGRIGVLFLLYYRDFYFEEHLRRKIKV